MGDRTGIGDLPLEMLCEVLKQLCLADLIRCKRVCKDWNSLVSTGIKLSRLVVDRKRNERIRWHYDNRPVIALELCEPNLFLAKRNQPILLSLKSLKIYCEIDEFNQNDLNRFTNLLNLEITQDQASDLSLSLPKLEFLCLELCNHYDFEIAIDCPSLRTLRCEDDEFLYLMKMKHPESVVELKTKHSESNLAQFTNLQRLITNDHEHFEGILQELPGLREIRFDGEIESLISEFESTDLTGQLKELLRGFLSVKRSLKRKHLEVYFGGLHVTDESIERIDLNERPDEPEISNEHFYMKNYEHLQERIGFVNEVNYTRLMSLVDEVPADYLHKFPGIYSVTVDGAIRNEDHLLGFLRRLDDFDYLRLKNVSNLSQAFAERLPEACANLWNFELSDSLDLELDYSFVRRFQKLAFITLQQELSLRSAKSIINVFSESSWLQDALNFRCKGVFYRIERPIDGLYHLYVGSDLKKENCASDDVISYLEQAVSD